MTFFWTKSHIVDTMTEYEKVLLVEEVNKFSDEKLQGKIKELGFKYPHIVMAQAILETGNFKSPVFRENHNLFGMKEPNVRTTTALGTKNSHAYYSDWVSSVYDYAMFQNNRMQGVDSESKYYAKLADGYAADSTYASVIRKTVDSLKLKKHFQE